MFNGVLRPYNPNLIHLPRRNKLKGNMTQTFAKHLLEIAGYTVMGFGIEEIVPSVSHLPYPDYMALNIPLQLRKAPDYIAVRADLNAFFLVEVKYRRTLDEKSVAGLNDELTKQYEWWPTTHTMLMISQPFRRNGTFHQDYIRVITPEKLHLLSGGCAPKEIWDRLPSLIEVFPGMKFVPCRHLDDVAEMLRDLPLSR